MNSMKAILLTVVDVAISLVGGFLIPLGLFFLLLYISGLDWDVALEDRNPFAWILFWPHPIWKRMLKQDYAETATIITTVGTFSVAIFAILRLSTRRRRLS
jgi:hypothetical protein